MTEDGYQATRKVMQRANFLRGRITAAEGEVAKWTKIEDSHRKGFRQGQADGAKKMLDKAMKKLDDAHKAFADLQLPNANLTTAKERCPNCGRKLIKTPCECIYE